MADYEQESDSLFWQPLGKQDAVKGGRSSVSFDSSKLFGADTK
jgi:hypothetical protein